MKGYSLDQDLKLLLNNPKYSDIEIICEDNKRLYASRAILAARSEVFDGLLYNGMKESYENQISFPTINSFVMEIVLEYAYTGSIKEESITEENIIEAFSAADYFQLPNLQEFIMRILKNALLVSRSEDYLPEFLSKVVKTMPFTENNILVNLLVEELATIPLNAIEFGRLSLEALQCLLSHTHEKAKPFATPEYEVLRYSVILAGKKVSNDAYEILFKQLPVLEQIENQIQVENNFTDCQKVAEILEPLIEYIDFKRIKGQILAKFIEPLGIIPSEVIMDVYRYKVMSNDSDLNDVRGISSYAWDELACGSRLIIKENGNVVESPYGNHLQSIRSRMSFENEGIYEWDVIIERKCKIVYVGVCGPGDLNYEKFAGSQPNGWVLGSNGNCCNSGIWQNEYCNKFGDGARVTVHLNMNCGTCAFTVNGVRYPDVLVWNDLPSRLYPVASLCHPGRLRIQPSQNVQIIELS
ncbi:uncharacterized protein OCT59_000866 [Rhizophagus irregularis]|uniref:Btb/poz domain containing protein n=4 Tax=Rhizophagus irregularis TaxID=588596 RepID=A0A916ELD9_9GLOM|nr:hypothetical protein RirG_194770 [Rhizophagus irregularis DAOM 197198w]UZN99599.1 hypothetical protein OCT59_000866 [Rhizophagus irregularis]GBC28450.1 hypothetical protein GLOIN_2v1523308 [Rhizophagus irregularis DAOM 181602=DAOM 197198]CAB5188826.1 unnamed protein product [Rhizophagus irregularis]CAB5392710.1 unnamed protein product [Rhizophagus irregularis]